jgi:putative membrane protein
MRVPALALQKGPQLDSHRSPRRFPKSVFGVGEEPDPRFTLANERTFLAWTRTALALIAGGVALELIGGDLQPSLRLAGSIVLLLTGALLPMLSWADWMAAERALRQSRPLPRSPLGGILAVAVTCVAVLVILAVFLR